MNFQLANSSHEAALRELARQSSMPGWIRLAFGREPDFFQAVNVQGKSNQVLVALEGSCVVGMGCRSIKPVWVNGQQTEIGYLGGLRLIPDVRRTGALARGYAALRRLHEETPVPAYLTTVVEGNTVASDLLTSGRAGLPHYLDHGRYFTYAVNLSRLRRKYASPLTVLRGHEVGLDSIVRFLGEMGRQRQFFPVLEASDFNTNYLRGLRLEDFRVAVRGRNEIVGVTAAWDQNSFKQSIVRGYAAPVRWIRPVLNGLLRLTGFSSLPAPGGTLDMVSLAFFCVRDDQPDAARALLEQVCSDLRGGPYRFLVLGLHERDPMRALMAHFRAYRYTSRLFLVCWDDGLDFVKNIDPVRIPYLDVATL
ncbi:MAG: hypothetical protein WCS01_06080 [bacterium]